MCTVYSWIVYRSGSREHKIAQFWPICFLARGEKYSGARWSRFRQQELAQLDLDSSLCFKHAHYSELFLCGQLVLTFSDSLMQKDIDHWFMRKRWYSKRINCRQRVAGVECLLRFYSHREAAWPLLVSLKPFSWAVISFLTQALS